MAVGLPADAVGRPSPGFGARDDLAHALGLPLVGGADDDPVSDMRFHDASWRTVLPFGVAVLAVLGSTFTPVPELITAGVCILLLIVEVRFAGLVSAEE